MARLWSSDSREQQEEEEDPTRFHDFHDLGSCFLDHFSDFDPVKEWLVDPDQNPMPESDLFKESDGFDSIKIELGHQDRSLESSIGEKMENVSLSEPPVDPNSDDGKKIEVLETSLEVGNGVADGLVGEVKNDGFSEVCTVSDPIKVADESDEEESSEESEESEDSSTESSSSCSSSGDEEDGSSSSDGEKEDDEKVIEIEEGEINGDDLEEVLGSDGEEEVPRGPIKSKREVEVKL